MRVPAIGIALAIAAGCGAQADGGPGDPDGPPPSDAPSGCSVVVTFDPEMPVAGQPTPVRAQAIVLNAPGVLEYDWRVTFEGAVVAHEDAQPDRSAIAFPVAQSGVYLVQLDVSGAAGCPTMTTPLNVVAPGANAEQYRLRVAPRESTHRPAIEKLYLVPGGGAYSLGTVSLDEPLPVTGAVRSGAVGVPAYLRFAPAAASYTAAEALSDAAGSFSISLLSQVHDVLVIPTDPAFAPRRVSWSPGQGVIAVGAGSAVTGVVRGPTGAALAGAKVQLTVGGVPSTLATTAANGSFTLRAEPSPGATVAIDVAPPAASGLPRLAAESAGFDLGQPVQIDYAALALRDLAGTTIRRGGAPVGGANVVLVGTLGAAGTVTAGAAATASGVVRVAATANAAGALPATLAPARALSAVVEVAVDDHAVAAVDLTAGVPASIDAPVRATAAAQLQSATGQPLAGAVLDAAPVGALALAGVSSVIRARAAAGGQVSIRLAAGGHYDLRAHDPQQARGAPAVQRDATAQTVEATYRLRKPLAISGTVKESGGLPIGGAAVQLLCSTCSGLERSRPVAEGSTEIDGTFRLVIPDPGTL